MITPTYADLWSTCAPAARRHLLTAIAFGAFVLVTDSSFAQSLPPQSVPLAQTAALPSSTAVQGAGNTQTASLTCTSELGGRRPCPADTSAGVALMKSTGPSACLLGKYPDRFLFGTDTVAPAGPAPYFGVFEMWGPVFRQLTPEASLKVRKGNYERLFDAAR